jgi:2-oxoglutarate ferredoxin oxidoreductase subunit beta
MLKQAWAHQGTSFIEIYQNCNIFNDKAFADVVDKKVRDERQIMLQDGAPMLFGVDRAHGLIFKDGEIRVATLGENGVTVDDILVHNATADNSGMAFMLAQLRYPAHPEVFGVLRQVERACYEDLLTGQIEAARQQKTPDLNAMLHSGYTWTVE